MTRRSGGPVRCPRPCSECGPDHHTGDLYAECRDEDDEETENHPAAKLGIEMWWACKHCDWWAEVLDNDEGGPTA